MGGKLFDLNIEGVIVVYVGLVRLVWVCTSASIPAPSSPAAATTSSSASAATTTPTPTAAPSAPTTPALLPRGYLMSCIDRSHRQLLVLAIVGMLGIFSSFRLRLF